MKKFLKLLFIFLIFIFVLILIFKKLNIDKQILKRLYPKEYEEYVIASSQEFDIDENLIYAIIKNESNFENTISSHKGAQGLMQLMESTALEVASSIGISDAELSDPEINIKLGTYYYSKLYSKYKSFGLALAAYNAGSGNVDKWIENGIISEAGSNIENIPFKETNMYVRKVLQTKEIYDYIYD